MGLTSTKEQQRAFRLRGIQKAGKPLSDIDTAWLREYQARAEAARHDPKGTKSAAPSGGAPAPSPTTSKSAPAPTATPGAPPAKGPVDANRPAAVPPGKEVKQEPKPGDACAQCGTKQKGPKQCPGCGAQIAMTKEQMSMLLRGMNMTVWSRFPMLEIVNGKPTIHVDKDGNILKTLAISEAKGFMGNPQMSEMDAMSESTVNLLDHYDIHLAQGLVVWLAFGSAASAVMLPRFAGIWAFYKWQKMEADRQKAEAARMAHVGATINKETLKSVPPEAAP